MTTILYAAHRFKGNAELKLTKNRGAVRVRDVLNVRHTLLPGREIFQIEGGKPCEIDGKYSSLLVIFTQNVGEGSPQATITRAVALEDTPENWKKIRDAQICVIESTPRAVWNFIKSGSLFRSSQKPEAEPQAHI